MLAQIQKERERERERERDRKPEHLPFCGQLGKRSKENQSSPQIIKKIAGKISVFLEQEKREQIVLQARQTELSPRSYLVQP